LPRFRDLASVAAVSHGFRQMVLALSPEYVLSLQAGQEDTLATAASEGFTRLTAAMIGTDCAVAGIALSYAVRYNQIPLCKWVFTWFTLPEWEWYYNLAHRAAYYGNIGLAGSVETALEFAKIDRSDTTPISRTFKIRLWFLSMLMDPKVSDARVVTAVETCPDVSQILLFLTLVPQRAGCIGPVLSGPRGRNELVRNLIVMGSVTFGNIPALEAARDHVEERHCVLCGDTPREYLDMTRRMELCDVTGEPCTWKDVFAAYDAHTAALTRAKQIVAERMK